MASDLTPPIASFITPSGAVGPVAALSSSEARLLVTVAKAQNSEALGRVIDDSLEASARIRRQREAEDAERRAEEARQARIDEIERRERAEAEALAEEARRANEEGIRRSEEDKARLAQIQSEPPPPPRDPLNPLDLSA